MAEITYAKALNAALRENLENDDSVFLIGEDIGQYGGVFQATAGLLKDFGPDRVIEPPIAETGFVGAAIGAALTGMRPVVEIMFIDFTPVCMDQIVNQMAKIHFQFGGRGKVPMVLRTNLGAGRGAAAQHSQSFMNFFASIPGLYLACPSTPYDAKGLLNEAIQNDNPVIFMEHKRLYITKGEVPEESYRIPFGQADVKRSGKDLTIVATHALVNNALEAAEEVTAENIDVEVVDPRTIVPLDKEKILDSVKKTGRLIVADEGHKSFGIASGISAMVAEEAVDYLKAPIRLVCSPDTPVPYSPPLEKAFVPGKKDLLPAIREIMAYA